jgi:hypothetical protein
LLSFSVLTSLFPFSCIARITGIFYTKNGKFLGVAFDNVYGSLYPIIGVDSDCPVRVNFGREPFLYEPGSPSQSASALSPSASSSAAAAAPALATPYQYTSQYASDVAAYYQQHVDRIAWCWASVTYEEPETRLPGISLDPDVNTLADFEMYNELAQSLGDDGGGQQVHQLRPRRRNHRTGTLTGTAGDDTNANDDVAEAPLRNRVTCPDLLRLRHAMQSQRYLALHILDRPDLLTSVSAVPSVPSVSSSSISDAAGSSSASPRVDDSSAGVSYRRQFPAGLFPDYRDADDGAQSDSDDAADADEDDADGDGDGGVEPDAVNRMRALFNRNGAGADREGGMVAALGRILANIQADGDGDEGEDGGDMDVDHAAELQAIMQHIANRRGLNDDGDGEEGDDGEAEDLLNEIMEEVDDWEGDEDEGDYDEGEFYDDDEDEGDDEEEGDEGDEAVAEVAGGSAGEEKVE